jgi:ATP-dependent helicase/nuclease subunit A
MERRSTKILFVLVFLFGYLFIYRRLIDTKCQVKYDANLRVLYDRARQFEETGYKGLFNFINFVDKLKSSRGDMGSAKILGENDNVVRIMSIHKSKGLEFPVVILAGCGKRFNLMDMNSSILLHQEPGFGPDVVDCSKRISWPSAAKLGIREKIKTENLSEEMRILYVAMTGAREKLIITGSVRNIEKSAARWSRTASVQDDKKQFERIEEKRPALLFSGEMLGKYVNLNGQSDISAKLHFQKGNYVKSPVSLFTYYRNSRVMEFRELR